MRLTYSYQAWKIIHDRDKKPWPQGVELTKYLIGDPMVVTGFIEESVTEIILRESTPIARVAERHTQLS